MTDPRLALAEMEKTLSRRALLLNIGKGVGVMAAYDRFGPRLFGTTAQTDRQNYLLGLQIVSAYGRMVIPVDQDPGWATFEPDITVYGMDVYIRQVFNLGRDLAFNGYLQALAADLIGPHGGPQDNLGFGIVDPKTLASTDQTRLKEAKILPLSEGDFLIGSGHYYVNGRLCENEDYVSYKTQAGFPFAEEPQQKSLAGDFLVYLDVWEREVTYVEDPDLLEPAREVAHGRLAILEVALVHRFLDADRERFEIARRAAAVRRKALGQDQEVSRLFRQLRVVEREEASHVDEPVFLPAHRAAVREPEDLLRDLAHASVSLAGLALLDEIGVLGEAARIEDERDLVAAVDRGGGAQVF
jgi:hypothetical protein